MEIISGIALILLTLVGYSGGSVLAGKGRVVAPGLFDVLVTIFLWAGALTTRDGLGRWTAVFVWVLVAGLVGALITALKRSRLEPEPAKAPDYASGPLPRRLWESWKAFAARIGDYQGRMLLIWFYFLVVTPFGLITRLFSDPLRTGQVPAMGGTTNAMTH